VISRILLTTSECPSGVKTLEFAKLFGTAEAVPSRQPFMRYLVEDVVFTGVFPKAVDELPGQFL
jgi:hypothetical protein